MHKVNNAARAIVLLCMVYYTQSSCRYWNNSVTSFEKRDHSGRLAIVYNTNKNNMTVFIKLVFY